MNLRLVKRNWQNSNNCFEAIDSCGIRVYLTLEVGIDVEHPIAGEDSSTYLKLEWKEVPIVDEYNL